MLFNRIRSVGFGRFHVRPRGLMFLVFILHRVALRLVKSGPRVERADRGAPTRFDCEAAAAFPRPADHALRVALRTPATNLQPVLVGCIIDFPTAVGEVPDGGY